MIDLGDFTPDATVGPSRDPVTGAATLGRLTTTDEQRAEVIAALTEAATRRKTNEARATVHWSRGEASVLGVTFTTEHLDGEAIRLPDQVTEYTLDMAVIPPSEAHRLRVLQDELADLHDKQML